MELERIALLMSTCIEEAIPERRFLFRYHSESDRHSCINVHSNLFAMSQKLSVGLHTGTKCTAIRRTVSVVLVSCTPVKNSVISKLYTSANSKSFDFSNRLKSIKGWCININPFLLRDARCEMRDARCEMRGMRDARYFWIFYDTLSTLQSKRFPTASFVSLGNDDFEYNPLEFDGVVLYRRVQIYSDSSSPRTRNEWVGGAHLVYREPCVRFPNSSFRQSREWRIHSTRILTSHIFFYTGLSISINSTSKPSSFANHSPNAFTP